MQTENTSKTHGAEQPADPVSEVLEQVKYDCDLIKADMRRKDLKSAIHGVEYQIGQLQELRDNLKKVVATVVVRLKQTHLLAN